MKFADDMVVVGLITNNDPLRPYNDVENVGFRWMVHTLEPRYVMPQCKYMANVAVPKMYEEVKEMVKQLLVLETSQC